MVNENRIDVSVVIPCYNCEAYIDETLKSLESQSFKNFEVVCVNDGSEDNTLSILTRWQNDSNLNISVINQDNFGVSRARNNAIAAAKGTYILFLDADDIFHHEMIKSLFNAVEGVDVAYCRLSRDMDEVKDYPSKNVKYVDETQTDAMSKLLYQMGTYGFYCYIYKKSVILEQNIFFDENTKHFEDREFIWKYLCYCKNIVWFDAPLYGYRINVSSVTQRTAQWHTDGLEAIRRVERYLKDHNCSFLPEVETYLFARAIWGVAKSYTISKRKDLFYRLSKEYDLKTYMKRTLRDNNLLVCIASALYLIHPMLFYIIVGMKK